MSGRVTAADMLKQKDEKSQKLTSSAAGLTRAHRSSTLQCRPAAENRRFHRSARTNIATFLSDARGRISRSAI
jgi:hypothetical protein